MTEKRWRNISPAEAAVVTAIASASDLAGARALIDDLDGALGSSKTEWILDIKTSNVGSGVDLPDGPFPGSAFVPSSANHQGEIIVWVANGHLSGCAVAIIRSAKGKW